MRVAVAMSGGVDSSVTAALLKRESHQVIGLSMQLYDHSESTGSGEAFGGCCSPADLYDARSVATHLDIPHYVINLEDEFEHRVVGDFVDQYSQGRTPNPCIRCNQWLKFRVLLDRARGLGADALATGHYARIHRANGRRALLRGVDRSKDQSYFLFTLTQPELSRVLFPLGDLEKAEVRELAGRLGLPVAEKTESQEVCFVGGKDYEVFIDRRLGEAAPPGGEICDEEGRVIGFHRGIHRFTVGQRRGLGHLRGGPRRLFVLHIDARRNRITVGAGERLLRRRFLVGEVSWVSDVPRDPFQVEVQFRYRHPPVSATLKLLGAARVEVQLTHPQRAIAPGQAAVFYRGSEVLGGGWIA